MLENVPTVAVVISYFPQCAFLNPFFTAYVIPPHIIVYVALAIREWGKIYFNALVTLY
jgi:hypothetical protein